MGRAMFYHLTHSPLEAALPSLLQRAVAAGLRAELRGSSAERLAWLDQRLWLTGEAEFLPHGLAGGPHDDLQPVLLTMSEELSGGTAYLMAIDGARIAPDEAKKLERACVMFDGSDEQAVQSARAQWKALTAAGIAAQYWGQKDGGGWEMKHEAVSKA